MTFDAHEMALGTLAAWEASEAGLRPAPGVSRFFSFSLFFSFFTPEAKRRNSVRLFSKVSVLV